MENKDIGEIFLLNFVSSILEIKAPSVPQINSEHDADYDQMQKSIMHLYPEKPSVRAMPILIKQPNIKIPPLSFPRVPQPPKSSRSIQQIRNRFSQMSADIQTSLNEKIDSIFKDPFVSEVECVGSEEPLFIRKSGLKQKTQIIMSIEEIYDLIAEFSQKARIPVINGNIRAAVNNLIITGFLSEKGPRFIIQKKRFGF